jgi:hypothetical protein
MKAETMRNEGGNSVKSYARELSKQSGKVREIGVV